MCYIMRKLKKLLIFNRIHKARQMDFLKGLDCTYVRLFLLSVTVLFMSLIEWPLIKYLLTSIHPGWGFLSTVVGFFCQKM